MEQTQANAPAPAQAQQPVHPIIEEQSIVERLTKYVRDTPENDPNHPENTSAVPETKTEASPEATDAPAEEVVEFDEETPFFELEHKGTKQKLSAKQIREGYLAKQDYHREIQKVKAQEAELSTRAQQAELKASQEYVQRLEHHKQAVQRLAGVKTIQEIEALSRQDPAAAQQEFLRLVNVNQTMQAIETEQRGAQQKQQMAMQAAHRQAVEKAKQTLEANIKGWGPELYTQVLGGVAKEYGFQNQEVEPVVDARLIELFHDAYQYRQLQKAKPEISKRVMAVPKVVKPGSADKPNPSSTAADDLRAKAKKSGDWRDMAKAYLARQKQK